jgi:hypothetical protein
MSWNFDVAIADLLGLHVALSDVPTWKLADSRLETG